MTRHHGRRDFLKTAAVGAAAAAFVTPLSGCAPRSAAAQNWRDVPLKLGVASYSLRQFSRADAIQMVKEMGASYICLKDMHMPYDSTPAEFAAARREYEEAGLQIVGGGTNNIREDTDEAVRPFFEYAKNAGIPLLVIAPTHDNLPRIERFVKEYDIMVAIHNHGPEDNYFPAPSDAIERIKDMDPRVGVCVDVGHTTRTGVDIVEAFAQAGDRVLDIHIKDLRDLMDGRSQTAVGRGAMPIAAIFKQLKQMNYQGHVNLEYEINARDPLAGMVESFAHMRGVLRGLETV
jgi:sugar phosphate isomerase/epimerase